MDAFIYGLVDPGTRQIIYVGQSSAGMARPRRHTQKGWVYEIVVLELVDHPRSRVPSLCPWLPDGRNQTALHELERWWIAYGRASGWPLRNKTAGGQGCLGMRFVMTEETKAKISASKRNPSPETRARISAATRRQFSDPAARARFSKAQREKPPMSAAARAKLSAAGRGRRMSESNRARLSERSKRDWPKVRDKIIAAVTGRSPSAEVRAKMSAAARARDPAERARVYEKTRNPSPETRLKMSRASSSRSPETIEKIRRAALLQWERKRADSTG